MAYNEKLRDRVRNAFGHLPNIEEKRMFRGIVFMVNGKMCISVADNEIMCRIDPALHDASLEKKGVRPVIMRGREYRGYIYVNEEGLITKKQFDYWIDLALDFNKRAKASKKKISKKKSFVTK